MATPASPFRSTLLKTTHSFIHAINSGDLALTLSLREPTCKQRILPSTLGMPPMSNEFFADFYNKTATSLRNFRVGFSSTFDSSDKEQWDGTTEHEDLAIDEVNRKVVLRMNGRGEARNLAGEEVIYQNEYVFFLKMNAEGKLLEEIAEYIDSAFIKGFQEKMAKGQNADE